MHNIVNGIFDSTTLALALALVHELWSNPDKPYTTVLALELVLERKIRHRIFNPTKPLTKFLALEGTITSLK
jgi:hypothetical protein